MHGSWHLICLLDTGKWKLMQRIDQKLHSPQEKDSFSFVRCRLDFVQPLLLSSVLWRLSWQRSNGKYVLYIWMMLSCMVSRSNKCSRICKQYLTVWRRQAEEMYFICEGIAISWSYCGVSTDPEKISAVQNWPVSVSVKEVRSFIGLCGYYYRFIQGFADIAKCLHRLTEKGRAFIWNQECQIAFETLKSKLIESAILAHPDFTKSFILDADASLESIGGVLSQKIDGRERVIAYGSHVLSKTERRYCVTRRELLAIVFFVSHFRHYLYGRKFKIRTDHGSLRRLLRLKNPEGLLARWLEVLSTYDMEIEQRPGKQHLNADTLSRIPCRQYGYDPEWEKAETANRISTIPHIHKEESDQKSKSLQEIQAGDSNIQLVVEWLKAGKKPDFSKVRGLDTYMKSLWWQF